MEADLDKYFALARRSEVSITIGDIEKKIAGITTVVSASLIKTLFTKYPIIMSSISGIVVAGAVTLFMLSYQTGNTPQNQHFVPVQKDSTQNENQSVEPQQTEAETNAVWLEEIEELKNQMNTAGMTKQEIIDRLMEIGIEEKRMASDDFIAADDSILKKKCVDICTKNRRNTDSASGLDYVSKFRYNYGTWAMVERDGYYGMIDMQMKVVVPVIYDEIAKKFSYNDDTWCLVNRDGYSGFIDMTGKLVVETKYEAVNDFKECFGAWAKVSRDGYSGYIDRFGKIVVSLIYEELNDFKENSKAWARVSRNGYFGFIDMTGKEVVPAIYDKVNDFKENDGSWAKVFRNGYYGFIDMTGKEVVPAIYDEVNDFTENHGTWAKVYCDGYCYFLDRTGKELKVKE
jgi:hypothetical protein